jgi:CRISPR/Cas system-associated exonuclease Cas4 (RecB family)
MRSQPFLKEIAALLLNTTAYHLPDACVVFPNKRARLYLSKYIGELTEKPVWAPRYLTINDLMESLSGYIFADRLTLLFELFEVYKKTTGSSESFDSFYPYSEALLADFDEIDKYLADAKDLFGNLADLKSLDGRFNYLSADQLAAIKRFWSTFDPDQLSQGQQAFLSLWKSLPEIYESLKTRLHALGIAFEGMAYRAVADKLARADDLNGLIYEKYLFVGFNALNKCEEKLFRYLRNNNRAEFFWDYDSWYTNSEIQEAGYFIRKNLRDFPQKQETSHDNLVDSNKNIFFLPVSSNSGQASALPYIFDKLGINDSRDTEHTALVLADEDLLIPVLYAIPERIHNINITMGYPMGGSAVFNLIDALYGLKKNSRSGGNGESAYFYKDVLSLLGNPLLKWLYGERQEQTRKLIVEKNLVYISVADFMQDEKDDIIFNDQKSAENTCLYLLNIVEYIIRETGKTGNPGALDSVQTEVLYQVYTFLNKLQDIIVTYNYVPGSDTLFKLIRTMLRSLHVPFNGEPLAGLQVLGILETRTLDFDNVIILSMNEGILPRSSSSNSFIPYSLRVGFSLPVPEHLDSIYAYYFYRLIQRAKNVMLLYDNSTTGLRTGERSRFLHQLYYELPVPPKEITFSTVVKQMPIKPIVIEKSDTVFNAMTCYIGEQGKLLSPSAINEFLNCPLRFYFHHIAGLPQPEEIVEEIDARTFGNLLHGAMNILYSNFGTGMITGPHLEELMKNGKAIEKALDKAFSEKLFGGDSQNNRKPEGFNLIVRQVILKYIYQLIRVDVNYCPFSIVSLEKQFVTIFPLNLAGKQVDLKIGGVIDRIDIQEGKIRIIDYKTGTVKNAFSTIESLFDAGEKLRNDAVFQVLLYAYVYYKLHPGDRIVPGIYAIRNTHKEDFTCLINYGSKPGMLDNFAFLAKEFEELLQIHLAGLFNTRESFIQTSNSQICRYCAYTAICRRGTSDE